MGHVVIGGDAPVSIQTMWDKPIKNINDSLISELKSIEEAGCDIIRFAVPAIEDAAVLGEISRKISMPTVADIHFDYKIALECMNHPIAKIRINPGNIGADWKVKEVVEKAKDKGVPLRIGVNAGSLPTDLRAVSPVSDAMIMAVERQIELLDQFDFHNFVVSLKASDIETACNANTRFSEKYDYPLHLGITEAGSLIPSVAKTSVYLTKMLTKGIGNTVRVSISDDPVKEVYAAGEILSALGMNPRKRINLISCPKCARASFDTHKFTTMIQKILYSEKKDISVAVMGCVVNGPEESRHADLGITGAGKSIMIFKKGEIIRKVKEEEALDAFLEELKKF